MELIGSVQEFDPGARVDVWWRQGVPQVEPSPSGDWLVESAQLLLFAPDRAQFQLVRLRYGVVV